MKIFGEFNFKVFPANLGEETPLANVGYQVGDDGRSVLGRVDLRQQSIVRSVGFKLLLLAIQQIANQVENFVDFVTEVGVVRRRQVVDALPNVHRTRVFIFNLKLHVFHFF